MEKNDKPAWVKTFEDTYAAPSVNGYWNKPLIHNGGKDGPGGYRSGPGGRGAGGHSETSSLYSRYTTSSEDRERRKKSRRVGLCIVLTLLALLVAALVGLLIYYLLLADRPTSKGVGGVEGSVRVLNMTYDDDMANTSSQAFRDVAGPFCEELDSYIAASNYSDHYEGCEVVALRNVADVDGCLCYGVTTGSVMVDFQLHLNGTHTEDALKIDIHDVIENSVTKKKWNDVIYVLIKHFLVDIRFDWKMPYDGVAAQVTLPVYNLNYSRALADNNSAEFKSLEAPFCQDVDGIMSSEDSWLADRYRSCKITRFQQLSSDKGSVSFTLLFDGLEPRPIQQGLIYILMTGARDVEWHKQWLKMIGSLIVTPFGATNQLKPVNITGPPPDLTYVRKLLPVFNLTLTPDLGDFRSPLFINLTTEFCNDMAKFYMKSSLRDRYYNCKVLGFRPNPTRVEVRLGFKSDPWSGLDDSVKVVIRASAPNRFYGTLHLYRVGDLDVILDQIAANGVELQTSLRVVNLTYSSALSQAGSPQFLHHAALFCKDLEEFYERSELADRFEECGVSAFTPRPVKVHFYVVFRGTLLKGLTSSHIDVIKRFAKKVVIGGGWTAYLVGDLLVLPDYLPHSVLPTNITATTPTPTTTDDISPSSVIPGDMTKAIITGLLYNFTFNVDLLDPGSRLFKYIEKRFCDDVSRVYLASNLFLAYRGCNIELFRPAPDEVVFNLYFDVQVSRELESAIRYILLNESPKVNLTVGPFKVVEVLHLGDLYLTLRHLELVPTPSTSLTLPSTPPIDPTSLQTMTPSASLPPTTDVTPTMTAVPKGRVTFRYRLFNFTYRPGLGDPTSDLFRQYQRLLCMEIQDVFKASSNFYMWYEGCDIEEFGFDSSGRPYIEFHVLFSIGQSPLLSTTARETLETSRYRLQVKVNDTFIVDILPIGGLLLIIDEWPVTSSIITPSASVTAFSTVISSVEYGAVMVILYYETYALGYTADLQDSSSPRFLDHRQRVCSDLENWFGGPDSPFYLTYFGCDMAAFSSNPEGVTFTLTLLTDVTSDLASDVRTYLERRAPKRKVPRFDLLEVGNLLLIVDRYIIDVTSIPLPTDSYTVYPSLPTTPTDVITMTSTQPPTEPSTQILPSSSLVPIPTVMVSLQFGLANFFFTNDLFYNFSPRFQRLQADFCADIERFYRASPLYTYYRDCQINEFIPSTDPPIQPSKITFTLLLEMPYSQELINQTIDTLITQQPQPVIDGYVTIKAGELYLILADWSLVSPGNFSSTSDLPSKPQPTPTLPPTPTPTPTLTPPTTTEDPTYYFHMSFELVNMTWHPDLDESTSQRFRRHNDLFCAELNEFLPGKEDKDFQHYMACKIDNFSGQPLRVNFSLQFDTLDGLDLGRVHRLVIALIKEHAVRHTVHELMVFQIGDLLIDIDSVNIGDIPLTTVNIFDATAFEFTYNMFPGNFSPALLDKTSYEFRARAFEFCKDMDAIFKEVRIRNIRRRYLGCNVNNVTMGPKPSLTFTLVMDGTERIDPERLSGIIVFSRQQAGRAYLDLGGLLVSDTGRARYYYIMLNMFSTHRYPTTPTPTVFTYVSIRLRVFSPGWVPEMGSSDTAYYQRMAAAFCKDISGWIKPEKPDYMGCEVLRFGNDPVTIVAELKFLGEKSASLRNDVDTILMELPDMEVFGNVITLRMGDFYIFKESLDLGQRTVPFRSTTPGTTPSTTPRVSPTPSRPTNPCLLGGDLYRHPTLCDRFIQCIGAQSIEIACGAGSVYVDTTCKSPNPGFQCTPLAG